MKYCQMSVWNLKKERELCAKPATHYRPNSLIGDMFLCPRHTAWQTRKRHQCFKIKEG